MTFKNRADYLDKYFTWLIRQGFDLKVVQICIADGGSSDHWKAVVHKWYKFFHSIKTAFCDRDALPFKVASNCPATDRNAMIVNMADAEKIIVTDPEVLFTSSRQLDWIYSNLIDRDLMIYHPCHRVQTDATPLNYLSKKEKGKTISYGGFCLCFFRKAFIDNGGFDERYALGFAGEDSYFIWWWSKNRRAKSSKYPVIHLWHPSPSARASYKKLRREYTLPLHERLKKENAFPNKGTDKWFRPETIKEVEIWQL